MIQRLRFWFKVFKAKSCIWIKVYFAVTVFGHFSTSKVSAWVKWPVGKCTKNNRMCIIIKQYLEVLPNQAKNYNYWWCILVYEYASKLFWRYLDINEIIILVVACLKNKCILTLIQVLLLAEWIYKPKSTSLWLKRNNINGEFNLLRARSSHSFCFHKIKGNR